MSWYVLQTLKKKYESFDRQILISQISTFDGDTPTEQRAFIKSNATIIFTNPDMLHHAILPHAKSWSLFLSQLTHVVVDGKKENKIQHLFFFFFGLLNALIELHVYNGLFGTHVALIMRRLTRLCRYYNNENIKFISCSATIEHPDKVNKIHHCSSKYTRICTKVKGGKKTAYANIIWC